MRGHRGWSTWGLLLAWGCTERAGPLGRVDASDSGLVDAAEARDGGRTADAAPSDSGPPPETAGCEAACDLLAELGVAANVERFEDDPRIADARCTVSDALLAACQDRCAVDPSSISDRCDRPSKSANGSAPR